MNARILFVDDEPNVLASFQRMFRRDYDVDVADSGTAGLARISASGPYAIVLSDMRMPGMNGADFLARVREVAPETVRMVLTGEIDIASAVKAVNEGWIFRFLLKPCPDPTMRGAVDAALRQYQLQAAERELLQKTLRGSIKVLTEMLSLVNPVAFGRSVRIQRYVRHVAEKLKLGHDTWEFEVAGMLSQIGCIAIQPATLEAVHASDQMPESERHRYMMHASVAHDLLIQIPRLGNVAMMICRQHESIHAPASDDPVTLGAQILKVCLAVDQRLTRGATLSAALSALRMQPSEYNATIVAALADLHFDATSYHAKVVPIARLEPGMIMDEDVRTTVGLLLVTRGQETTEPMLARLRNFHQNGAIGAMVRVLVLEPGPGTGEAAVATALR